MAVSKLKLRRFIETKDSVRKIVVDSNSLNTEIAESVFFNALNKRFVFALAKHNIIFVGDLIFSDDDAVLKAVNESQTAIVSMTRALKKIYIANSDELQNRHFNNISVPPVSLVEIFFILNNLSDEDLDRNIDLGSDPDVRLCNALRREHLYKYSEIKSRGINDINNISGLGRKSFQRFLLVVKEEFKNIDISNKNAESVVENEKELNPMKEFRKKLKESFSSLSDLMQREIPEFGQCKVSLFDCIFNYVSSHFPQRQSRIYIMKTDPTNRKRTLEEVGKYFGLTRERIRQIVAKTDKSLKYSFMRETKCESEEYVKRFYETLMSIEQSELPYYVSLFISEKNIVSTLLQAHLKSIGIDESQLPNKKPIKESSKEKAKSIVKKLEDIELNDDEKLTYLALSKALSLTDAITLDILDDYINGKTSFGKSTFYFNSRAYFSINYNVDLAIEKLMEIGLVCILTIEDKEYLKIDSKVSKNKKIVKKLSCKKVYKKIKNAKRNDVGDEEVQYVILSFVNSFNNKYSVHTIVNVLLGEETTKIVQLKLQKNRFFGELEDGYTKNQIYNELYGLKKSRYLHFDKETKRVSTTKKGLDYLAKLIRK